MQERVSGTNGTAVAAAKASAAVTEGNDLVAYVQSLGTAEVNYASNDASQFVTQVQAIDAADKTAADSEADLFQTFADALAADEGTFETALAPAVQTWQDAIQKDLHDDTYAVAQALYNLTIGTYTESQYLAAVNAASATQAASDQAANQAYSSTYGTAQSTQVSSDASATLTRSVSEADAILTDIKADAAAIDVYLDAESGDYDVEQKAVAAALDTYTTAVAAALASAIASLDQNNPSPWADQAAAMASAESTQAAASASAQQTASDTSADDLKTSEIAANDAQATWTDNAAQAAHDQAIALAQALDNLTISNANTMASLASADAYFTALGSGHQSAAGLTGAGLVALTPPGGDTPLTLTGAYNDVFPIGAYTPGATTDPIDGLIGRMFKTPPDGEPTAAVSASAVYTWFGAGGTMPYGIIGGSVQTGINSMLDGTAPHSWSSIPQTTTFGPQIFAQNGQPGSKTVASGGATNITDTTGGAKHQPPRRARARGKTRKRDWAEMECGECAENPHGAKPNIRGVVATVHWLQRHGGRCSYEGRAEGRKH